MTCGSGKMQGCSVNRIGLSFWVRSPLFGVSLSRFQYSTLNSISKVLDQRTKNESSRRRRKERHQLTGGRQSTVVINKWTTVDGPLGISGDESVACASRYFLWGFSFLPLLWAANRF